MLHNDGASLLALVATLERALGGNSPYPPLPALQASHALSARCVVLLVVDGMGEARLARHDADLLRHRLVTLRSVFPSSTAPAITTLLTGRPPAMHGVPAWDFAIEPEERVLTFLPFQMRDGLPMPQRQGQTLQPADVLCCGPLAARLTDLDFVSVSPRQIVDSAVTQALTPGVQRVAFDDFGGLLAAIESAVAATTRRRFVYAYWGELDALSHAHGVDAEITRMHQRAVADGIRGLGRRLSGYGATLLVTADHGFVDTPHVCDLASHPQLRACLRKPLCGEPRAAFCYVHPEHRARFIDYVDTVLATRFECIEAQALATSGALGTAEVPAEILRRYGDFVLVGRDGSVLVDSGDGRPPFRQVGVHGGLLADELEVPLLVFAD